MKDFGAKSAHLASGTRRDVVFPLIPALLRGLCLFSLAVAIMCCCAVPDSHADARTARQGTDVEGMLHSELQARYPWSKIEIESLSIGDAADGPFKGLMIEKAPPGRTVFSVEGSGGRRVRGVAIVKAYDYVVMPGRAYGRGYSLEADDVYMTLMDVTRIPRGAIRDTEEAVGKSLTRSIVAGRPITQAMVSESELVKRGRRVTIVVEAGPLSATASGETKENAYIGDTVKVMNIESRRVVSGRLTDGNTVKVIF